MTGRSARRKPRFLLYFLDKFMGILQLYFTVEEADFDYFLTNMYESLKLTKRNYEHDMKESERKPEDDDMVAGKRFQYLTGIPRIQIWRRVSAMGPGL